MYKLKTLQVIKKMKHNFILVSEQLAQTSGLSSNLSLRIDELCHCIHKSVLYVLLWPLSILFLRAAPWLLLRNICDTRNLIYLIHKFHIFCSSGFRYTMMSGFIIYDIWYSKLYSMNIKLIISFTMYNIWCILCIVWKYFMIIFPQHHRRIQ